MNWYFFTRATVGISVLAVMHSAVAATPGVTSTTITFGQSAAFSGPAAKLGESMRDGMQVYFDQINRQGGVHGRRIQLTSLSMATSPTVPYPIHVS